MCSNKLSFSSLSMGVVRGSIPRESIKNVQFIHVIPSVFFWGFFWSEVLCLGADKGLAEISEP
jgi:hypothetical protein